MSLSRRHALKVAALGAAAAPLALAIGTSAAKAGPQFTVALNGYDAVLYHTKGKAKAGSVLNTFHWSGATWVFDSPENRDLFAANPEQYAPAFDGYCAFAAALGYVAPGDPNVWHIEDGVLYLNVSARAQETWSEDIPGNIAKAEENWPRLNPI